MKKYIITFLLTKIGRKICKIKKLDKYFAELFLKSHKKNINKIIDSIDLDKKDILIN